MTTFEEKVITVSLELSELRGQISVLQKELEWYRDLFKSLLEDKLSAKTDKNKDFESSSSRG